MRSADPAADRTDRAATDGSIWHTPRRCRHRSRNIWLRQNVHRRFTLAPAVDALERERFYATISREQIRLLDADVLVWLSGTPALLESLKADALLQQLDVARRGDVIYVDNDDFVKAFSSSTVLSLPYAIDTFVPQLAAVVG